MLLLALLALLGSLLGSADAALCADCLGFMSSHLDEAKAAIDAGIAFACDELCKVAIRNSTHVQHECDVLCTLVGMHEFEKAVGEHETAVSVCAALHLCSRCTGVAFLDSLAVLPRQGPPGTVFRAEGQMTVLNRTCTDELLARGVPSGGGDMLVASDYSPGRTPGGYNFNLSLTTTHSTAAGVYTAAVQLCNGDCVDGNVYDAHNTTFTVTSSSSSLPPPPQTISDK